MAKKENVEYLMSKLLSLPKFPTPVYDAMLTWVFGSEERTVSVCARTAFSGAYRGIKGFAKMPKQEKEAWREKSIQLVVDCIDELLSCCEGKPAAPDVFDDWHKNTCKRIYELSGEHEVKLTKEGFTYAQAAKALDMTIQNMLLMEAWDEELEPVRGFQENIIENMGEIDNG